MALTTEIMPGYVDKDMIKIGTGPLISEDFYKIIFEKSKISICDEAVQRVKKNHDFLLSFSKDKVIYGINTGFGPMAQFKIEDKDQIQLQYNLIRSHSSGTGNVIPDNCIKAILVARLNSLLQAKSGVNISVIESLVLFINNDVLPLIYEHGSVGASGDLVQLSHLALALIGEGEVKYKGSIRPSGEVLDEIDLQPIKIVLREGLALINGTSTMSGVSMINVIMAENLLKWSVVASAMINEIVESYSDHFSAELNSVKMHQGQQAIASLFRNLLEDSQLIKRRDDHLFNGNTQSVKVFEDKVQEYYSLRCVPQILGPVLDTIRNAKRVIEEEINSVNDNPIVDDINGNVYHGGNFHGDYVSLEMDKLKMAMTRLSQLAERQLNYLLNNALNQKLPPFVNLGVLGLNLGMQGVQFTATSTVAENQTLSYPMYVHSIPCNNDNQDIVSMGTNSALLSRKVVINSYQVMAIHFMAILQAVDYLKIGNKMSSKTRAVYQELREQVPVFVEDSTKYGEIRKLTEYLLNNRQNLSIED